ncbi:MAG TPA: DUF2520 domain-containing protein [Chloroflexota bacterium]|nr:DUF2520 domain-containing protein [Chloroflexota bacterium]
MNIGFVGAGRLASVLAPALRRAGYDVPAIASRTFDEAQQLAHKLPGTHAVPAPQAVADAVDLVFLTVPDDAIAEAAGAIRWRPGMAAVHCSGAASLELLTSAAEQRAQTGAFHPLQTFVAGQADLAGVTVAIEASGDLLGTLAAMAEALGCRPLQLPPGAKPLYHASSALAGNYLVTLLAQAARLWQPFGCSEADALGALLPLVKTAVANVERLGAKAALTGPIARGDAGTVRRHLQALEQEAPDLIPLYCELGLKTLPLTSLDETAKAEFEAILSNPKETQSCV